MTRSVEIPEEAVAVEAETWARAASGGMWSQYTAATRQLLIDNAKPTARAALEAALPYLAPAGDGGLREALEELASEIDTGSRATVNREAKGWQERTARRLRDVLAAHPAAPAVPQPVDREALAKVLRDHDGYGCGCCAFYDFDKYEDRAEAMADALLAVLAGEQEQVEK